jgi:hypothetical protein
MDSCENFILRISLAKQKKKQKKWKHNLTILVHSVTVVHSLRKHRDFGGKWITRKDQIFSLQLKLKLIYDRQSVDQYVLVSGAHLGPVTNFSFALKFPLDCCGFVIFVTPSLTRGRVCNLLVQLLLGLARAAALGCKSRRTQGYILLSHLRLP